MIDQGVWQWLVNWCNDVYLINSIQVPLINIEKKVMWQTSNGLITKFYVARVWDEIRRKADSVNWYKVVWYSHCIPRHTLILWLAILKILATQDRIAKW